MIGSGTNRLYSGANWGAAALVAGLIVVLVWFSAAVEPLSILLATLVLSLALIGFVKFPAAILVPVIFIPQWKTLGALEGLQSRVDLTVVALVVLSLVLLLQLVKGFPQGWSLRQIVGGEGMGIGAFYLFALVVSASYLYTPAPNWGLTEVTRLWGIGGLLLVSPLILIKEENHFRQFAITFLCFATVRAAQVILFPEYGKGGKTEDIIKTDIGAAWLIGMAILILLYYELFEARWVRTLVKLVCLPLLAAGLVAATARGPIVALVLVFLAVPLVSPRKAFRSEATSHRLVILILIVVGSWLSFSSLWWAQARFQQKTQEMVGILTGSTPGSGSAVERLNFYKIAIAEIPERPILGLGVGGWAVYYHGRDDREYPHNLFLLVAVEQGLLGIIALLAFLVTTSSALRRIIKATGQHFIVLFALVLFSLTVSMFSGDLDTNRLLWFWCGMTFTFSRLVRLSAAGSFAAPGQIRHLQY